MRVLAGATVLLMVTAAPAAADEPAPASPVPQVQTVRQATVLRGFQATVRTPTDGTGHRSQVRGNRRAPLLH